MSPADKPDLFEAVCRVQSIAKQDGDYPSANQDFAHPDLLALSDGAGGTGFYAADWAKNLCKELPTAPFADEAAFDEWFKQIRNPFFAGKREEAAANFPDILEDYDREGSSATLLAAWPGEDRQWRVLSYGDSAAFLFDAAGKLKQRSIPKLVQFTEDPYLLHSNEPLLPEHLYWETWTIDQNDTLLMASDALSQWILIQYALHNPELATELEEVLKTPYGLGNQIIRCREAHLNSPDFLPILRQLAEAVEDESSFQDFTRDLFQKGQLALDDYTLRLCSPIMIS